MSLSDWCHWSHVSCECAAILTLNCVYCLNTLAYLNVDNTKPFSEPRAHHQWSVLFSSSSLVPPLLASAVEANTNLSYKLLPVWIWLHWQLRDCDSDAQSSSPSSEADNVAFGLCAPKWTCKQSRPVVEEENRMWLWLFKLVAASAWSIMALIVYIVYFVLCPCSAVHVFVCFGVFMVNNFKYF